MRTLLLFGAIAFSCGLSAQCTVTITPSSDTIICNGASVTLEASGGNGTWAWSPATGLNSTTGNTVTASPPTTTTYSVTRTCPDSTDATATVTIEVLDLNVTAGPDILVCSENPINLISTVSGNGSNAVDYSWIGPNGYNSTSSSPTISNSTTAMSGDYTVTATVGGCQTQDVVNVIVADVQIASNQFVGNQLVYCLAQGETSGEIFFSLTIPSYSSSISNFSIDWDNNGTYDATYTNSTWSNPIIQNFPIGSSQFTIQMVLSNGCSVIQQYSVFVGSSPSPATLALFPNQANGCAPHTTEWNLTIPTLNVDGTTYTFNWGDGTSFVYIQGDPIPSDWDPNPNTDGGYVLTHVYTQSTCGSNVTLGGQVYYNTFQPIVVTQNPCSVQPQPSGTGLVSIGQGPTANFTPSNTNTSPINQCIGEPLQLNNTSVFGETLPTLSGAYCSYTSPFYWTITPSTAGLWTATGLGSNNGSINQINWTVGSMTPTVTFNTPGTYTITIRVKNICGDSYYSQDFCVQSKVTPLFTLNNSLGCAPLIVTANSNTTNTNVSCSPVTYLWTTNYTSGSCETEPSVTYLNFSSATSPNPTFQFNNAGNYAISLTTTNECGSETSAIQTVVVKQPPVVTISTSPTSACSNPASTTPTVNVTNCGNAALTYSWTFAGGTPANSTNQNPGSISFSTVGLHTIYLSVANECGTTTANTSFTIYPALTADAGSNVSICSGNSSILNGSASGVASPLSYSWTSFPVGFTSSLQNPTVFPSFTTTYFLTVTDTNLCTAISQVVVTVNPLPTVAVNSEIICIGQTATLNASGADTYSWSPNTNLSATTGATVTANPSSTISYTVTGTHTTTGCSTTAISTVTVNPLPVVDAGASITLCDQPIPETLTGYSPANGVWTGTGVTSGGVFTPDGVGDFVLTYTFTDLNSCVNSDTMIVSVVAPQVANAGTDLGICVNASIYTLTGFTPSGGIWSGVGVTGNSFNPTTAGVGTHMLTYSFGSGTCLSTDSIIVTVHPFPTVAVNSETICIGQIATLNASGADTYSWSPNTNLSATTGSTITANPSSTISYTVTGTNTTTGCSNTSISTVTVNPLPVVYAGSDVSLCDQPITYAFIGAPSGGAWSGSPNITSAGIFTPSGTEISNLQYLYTDPSTGCQNSDITVVTVEPPVIPSVLPTYSICANNAAVNLHTVLDPLPAGGDWTGTGVTNPTFTPSVAGAGVHTITYTIGAGTCLASVTSTITVNPSPNLTPIGPITICNNTAFNVNLASDMPSSFVWQAQATSTVYGEVSSAQTSSVINNTLTNTTTSPQNVLYTVTPTSVPQGCVGTSSNFTVTVMPDVILAIPTAIEICSGSSVNAQLSANVPSNFSWFTSFDNPNVTGESITVNSGALINDILVNNSATNQLVIYSVTPTSINGACIGLSQTITVMVKPPFALLNNDMVTICSGTSVGLALVANTSVTFNWFALPAVNVIGESITTITSQTITDVLTNNTASIQEVLYNVIATSTANGCSSPIFPVQVFVNPVPFMSDPIDQVMCNGLPTQAVNFISTVNNPSFTWSNTNASVGLAAGGVGVIPSFTAVNNTNAPITATITVNVYFENAGVICTGNTQTFTITVNPTPSVTQPLDQELCNDDIIAPINFNGNIFGTVFTWANDLPTIGLSATGTGSIASFAAINTTTVTEIATIFVTPNYTIGGVTCLGQPQDFTITIHPLAILTSAGTTICSNNNVNLPITSSVPATITWQANNNTNVTGESLTSNSSTTITDLLVNPGSVAEIVNYQVAFVTTGFGCLSGPFNIPVTVQPLPDVQFVELNSPLCNLDPIQFENNTPGANSYVWNFGDGNTSTLPNPTYLYQFPGTYSVSLTATNNLTGCVDSLIRSLIIHESPTVDFDISANQGCVLLDVVFTDLVNAPNTIVTWDFGDGQTSNQPNVVDHQYASPGCFNVSLTVVDLTGCSTTLTQSDLVCAFAQPNASFVSTPDSVNIDNPQIVFTNQSTNAYTYDWDFGDGGSSVATNPTHVYAPTPSNYVVTLYAYSQADCYDSLMMTIRVYEDIIYYVPNAFTPDNDGVNDVFMPVLTLGLDINNYQLLIFNRWGEQIFESHDRDIGWDGSYMNGDYFCQVGVYTWKIVVKASQNNDIIREVGHVTLLR